MNNSQPGRYEICVEGCLTESWSDWFDGAIRYDERRDETVIEGQFVDQAALFGILTKIHYLNLTLVAVKRLSVQKK
ncbi:MAG: hypothetical protein H6656_19790 [Ardenticatenaceae bacterium]|nr:hypothetical protein [Ardenticatenaceae bacterium]